MSVNKYSEDSTWDFEEVRNAATKTANDGSSPRASNVLGAGSTVVQHMVVISCCINKRVYIFTSGRACREGIMYLSNDICHQCFLVSVRPLTVL